MTLRDWHHTNLGSNKSTLDTLYKALLSIAS